MIFNLKGELPLVGDFNGDDKLDIVDIDMLVLNIQMATNNLLFDLNNDAAVDNNDQVIWFVVAATTNLPCQSEYFQGDINLDGNVNSVDSAIIMSNLGTMTAVWSTGDLSGDGNVTALDVILWSVNKGQVSCDMDNCAEINLSIRNEHFENAMIPSNVLVSGSVALTGEIKTNSMYSFTAKDSIVLKPDFEVDLGGQFNASHGCP
ncbi:MAG: hypothetical protein IPL46_15615 [Saprospiraceae bacterium]|nr:hypothetical protein [Saprospiraceae bacterium]